MEALAENYPNHLAIYTNGFVGASYTSRLMDEHFLLSLLLTFFLQSFWPFTRPYLPLDRSLIGTSILIISDSMSSSDSLISVKTVRPLVKATRELHTALVEGGGGIRRNYPRGSLYHRNFR
ncbi:uncharacterized protein LOC143192415 [Rhynchophorus ferrugineus]|uniref:uncharacterized protein LOC143192415 n=1 Tax=Rhynchophorus ferrugineus TaxID=354439 RepID=UPI003FCDA19F